jgi:hypothetical protein
MQLTIPTTSRKFFHESVKILRSVPPLNELRPQTLSLLAEILYWDYYYRDLPDNIRWKMVFDYDTTEKMMDKIPCDRQALYNNKHVLKKLNIIGDDTVKTNLGINPLTPSITINFKIND